MSETIEELSNRNVVKLSNDFILSKIRISKISFNIFLALLTEIDMNDKELRPYDIPVRMLANKLGVTMNINRKNLDKIVHDLTEKNLLLYGDNEPISLCSKCEIIIEKNVLYLHVVINPLLKHELLDLKKNFTKINLLHVLKMNSIYAKRLYMLLKKMSEIGYWNPSVDELRSKLSTPQSYNRYDNFKKIVNRSIDSIEELQYPEIKVSYTEDKRFSTEVKVLRFKIKKIDKNNQNSSKSRKRSSKETQLEKAFDGFTETPLTKMIARTMASNK